MEPEEIDDLKAMIAVARKRELSFGLCMGKSFDALALFLHRLKTPEFLRRKAKRLDGVVPAKTTLGTVRTKGRKLMLTCHEEPPPNLFRHLRKFFIGIDMPMKIILLDASGTVIAEEEDDEDADRVEAPGGNAEFEDLRRVNDGWVEEDNVNRAVGRWRKAQRLVGPRIAAYAKGKTPDAAGIGQAWARAQELGDERGDPEGAYRMLERIVGRIKLAKANQDDPNGAQEDDAMAAFKTQARRTRRLIDAGGASHALRAALVEAVTMAHQGDPAGALDTLRRAARLQKAES